MNNLRYSQQCCSGFSSVRQIYRSGHLCVLKLRFAMASINLLCSESEKQFQMLAYPEHLNQKEFRSYKIAMLRLLLLAIHLTFHSIFPTY